MIKAIVNSYYEGNDIDWKKLWYGFDVWCDSCPTCGQKCGDGLHQDWDGEDGQQVELERRLKLALKYNKATKKRKAS